MAPIAAGTAGLNKTVLRERCSRLWLPLMDLSKKEEENNQGRKEKGKGERKEKKEGDVFACFCCLWGKRFLKGGFVALPSITKFLLLIECLLFPVWWSLWLSYHQDDRPPRDRNILVLDFVPLEAIYALLTHNWHTSNTAINSSIHSLNRVEKERPSLPQPKA